jgi:hypothetical protein
MFPEIENLIAKRPIRGPGGGGWGGGGFRTAQNVSYLELGALTK